MRAVYRWLKWGIYEDHRTLHSGTVTGDSDSALSTVTACSTAGLLDLYSVAEYLPKNIRRMRFDRRGQLWLLTLVIGILSFLHKPLVVPAISDSAYGKDGRSESQRYPLPAETTSINAPNVHLIPCAENQHKVPAQPIADSTAGQAQSH